MATKHDCRAGSLHRIWRLPIGTIPLKPWVNSHAEARLIFLQWLFEDYLCLYRCLCFLLLGAVPICHASSLNEDKARLLRLVPLEIEALARAAPDCHPPGVNFTRADFDGDGSFSYVVASYFAVCGPHITSAVRVLKEMNGKLMLHQIPSGLLFRAGENLHPDVLDLENNGLPELLFRVWKGPDTNQEYSLLLFKWTSGTLQPISTERIDTRKAIFRDLYADGRLELVSFPRCSASTGSRKNAMRVLASTHEGAVSGLKPCPDTRTYVYRSGRFREVEVHRSEAKLTSVAASGKEFSLTEIRHSQRASETKKEFVLQLRWPYDPSNPASAGEIKPETLLLGRALRPLAVTARLQDGDPDCKSRQPPTVQSPPAARCPAEEFVEAHFDRQSVAKLLPKMQLGKKLEPGDLVSVPLTALMENGDYVSAEITVSISK